MHAIVPPGRNADLQSARDDELLRRFVAVRDQAAFEEIVRRHGPLVLSVCRRVLGHLQDAEDAFQATFLTLASRAGKIKRGVALPSWLHRVATRIARSLQRTIAERQRNMTIVELDNQRLPAARESGELKLMLDDELDRLPAKYKSAILLCDYCGYSRKDAASALKLPMGTLLTNLKRGRELLKQRLLRCGMAVSAVGIANALAKTASAAAPVSMELIHSTTRLSLLFLAGQTATKAAAPAAAVHLAQTTIRRMTMMKLLSMSMLCVGVGAIAVAVPEIARTNLVQAQPPIIDDFEDGSATDGIPANWLLGSNRNGSVEVVAGDLVLSGSAIGVFAEASRSFRDVTLQTQLRFMTSSGPTHAAYIFGRSLAGTSYFGAIQEDGLIAIGEGFSDAPLQLLTQMPTSLDPRNNDVLLRLDVIEDSISLTAWQDGDTMPAEPQLTANDNTLQVGTVGIGIARGNASSQVAFRSFSAVPEPTTGAISMVGAASLSGFVMLRRRRLE